MSREWKPGDVVRLGNNVAMRVEQDSDAYFISPIGTHWRDCEHSARPLVVIDPEDREAVERLARDLVGFDFDLVVERLQAGLRKFMDPTPPRPDEPKGLGAVVEDEDGTPWVRCENVDLDPHWYARNKKRDWHQIDAVRVLSEGVQP